MTTSNKYFYKMDKNKNIIIGILAIGLFGSLYFIFRTPKSGDYSDKIMETNQQELPQIVQEELTLEDWNSDPYSWQKLKCTPVSKVFCDRTSCEQDKPTVWIVLDRKAQTFSRCDVKGCDVYQGKFESDGAFTNIQGQSPIGTMIKVLGDKKYIEIATINLGSFISSGICTTTN